MSICISSAKGKRMTKKNVSRQRVSKFQRELQGVGTIHIDNITVHLAVILQQKVHAADFSQEREEKTYSSHLFVKSPFFVIRRMKVYTITSVIWELRQKGKCMDV